MNIKTRIMSSKFGYTLRTGAYVLHLPRYIVFFETHLKSLNERFDSQSRATKENLAKLSEQLATVEKYQMKLDEKVSDIKHYQLLKSSAPPKEVSTSQAVNNTMADDHTHDNFYKLFEDKFRGSEELIKERLLEYVPYLKRLSSAAKRLPVLDIGCGRGEFLAVVTETGLKAIGIDMNKSMVDRAKSLGFTAYENDALSYLLKQKSSSHAVISGFHLVEHIPFPALLKIFEECYRVIHPDGFIIFETPNPKNLVVGTSSFYLDPSHIKPIPPELLAFALEAQGFETQILNLHPAKDDIKHDDPVVQDIMQLVYGSLDYAVLASKKALTLDR